MKRAVILHGTDSKPQDLWFPWLKKQLETSGYSVFAPLLPDNHTPNREKYEDFLKTSGWDFKDNILIGHSSGATAVLNLLSSDWFPKVKASVLFGAFLNEKLVKKISWYESGQFDNLFLKSYEPRTLLKKCSAFYFVHGGDDPYCDYNDALELCNELGGIFITIKNGHHLAGTSGIKEFPEVFNGLQKDGII